MHRSLRQLIRTHGVLIGLVLLLGLSLPAVPAALAQSATPAATSGPDLDLGLTPGVVPTMFGDVAVPDRVERVITLTDGALDAVVTLGVEPVGATVSSNAESAAEYLVDRVPADVEYVGGWAELNIEAIVGLNPDVILADRYLLPEEFDQLSQVAAVIAPGEIEVAGPDALQQWEYEQLIWGHALNQDDAARQAILDLRAAAAGVKTDLAAHNGETVAVFRPQADGPIIMSHHWMSGTILTWAGFGGTEFTEEMPPPHGGQSSFEHLSLVDADWMFLATRDDEQRAEVANYEALPVFASLSAPQSGQVVVVDGDLWSGSTGVQAGYAMLADVVSIMAEP